MNKRTIAWLSCTLALTFAGCLPSTKVIKNPTDRDKGVRYYRPKPYLLIQPMVNSKTGEVVPGYVTLEQAILPDFSEEYSIHIRSGLGVNETEITLTDGWRLDGLNVKVDSQFDENVKAVADLARSLPSLTSSGAEKSRTPVKATNVPIGYYESVVSKGCDGKKRLYGFRYVGFMPYHPCPVESCGVDQTHCGNGVTVYGLVMEADESGGSAMVFKPLTLMAGDPTVEVHELPPPATDLQPTEDDDPNSEFEALIDSSSADGIVLN